MADVNITISNPTLGVGETFQERHRLLPSGAWSAYTTRTNAPFTLSLTAGTWEMEVYVLQADGTICPSTTRTINVVEPPSEDPYTCPTFTITQLANPTRLNIAYTGGTGTPLCGYKVRYRRVGVTAWSTVPYATLPTSPFTMSLPMTGQTYEVQVLADQCDGFKVCYDDEVAAPNPPECEEISGFDYEIVPIAGQFQGFRRYQITLTATTQSTIPTTSATFNLKQGYTLSPAVAWTGSFPITGISPTAFSVTFVVQHNFVYNIPQSFSNIYWILGFTDACGYTHNLVLTYV